MRLSHLLSLLALVAAGANCGGSATSQGLSKDGSASQNQNGDPSSENPEGTSIARSALARDAHPNVTDADQSALRDGNTAFALDLYQAVRATTAGNLFFSPHSISSVLAMTYAGAKGNTESQMAQALHFTLPQDRLHAAMNLLDATLATRHVQLNILNAAWASQEATFLDSFLDVLAVNYGAGVHLLDFGNSEAALQAINGWVSDNTAQKISEILPSGSVDARTTLVLTNAVYFNGSWQSPFDPAKTTVGGFQRADGSTVEAPMMRQMAQFGHAASETWEAIELPYAAGELSLVAIAPRSDPAGFESGLSAAGLSSILDSLVPESVGVVIPKFSFSCASDLIPPLKKLGMADAFQSGTADFSGMDGTHDAAIEQVRQRAAVDVNETGTEASAAAAVEMAKRGIGSQVILDHPFLFVIRDVETGAIVFLGWLADPTAT